MKTCLSTDPHFNNINLPFFNLVILFYFHLFNYTDIHVKFEINIMHTVIIVHVISIRLERIMLTYRIFTQKLKRTSIKYFQ